MVKYLILFLFPIIGYSDITYTNTVKKIFDTRCIGCHNNAAPPSRNWLTYENIFAKRALIRVRLFTGTMPPAGNPTRMTPKEGWTIIKWIDDGAKR